MASGHIPSWQRDREKIESMTDFIFLGSKITADGDCSHEVKRQLLLGRKAMTNLDSMLRHRHYFSDKGPTSQSYGFSSHVWMWELDHKESWGLTNWCFWILVLEKTLENPLDCKEIKPVHPKGNQSWMFFGRTDAEAEAEAPILWPPGGEELTHQLIISKASPDWVKITNLSQMMQCPVVNSCLKDDLRDRKSLKRPWCWESLKAGRERDDRGWDGWMSSLT